MSKRNGRVKRRVWIGLLVACAGVGAWMAWNRLNPVLPAAEQGRPRPFVRLAGAGALAGDEVLREKAELQDPTPLFFPTEWNFGQQPLRASSVNQPGQGFVSVGPKFTVGEQSIAHLGVEQDPASEKLVDVLIEGNEAPFAGMGQLDTPLSILAVRSGYLEVREVRNGNVIASQQLSGIEPPKIDFAPVEFLVIVDRAGLVGPPILTSGSGWEEVDDFFSSYLVKSYRLGERLHPGRYRVVVGI